jgi:hypothetical protein
MDIGHLLSTESSKSAAAALRRRRHRDQVRTVGTATSPSPENVEVFSEHEKHLLTSTWLRLSSTSSSTSSDADDSASSAVDAKSTRGVAIFLDIFEQRPAAKELFPFSHLSGAALLEEPLFKSHARRFMQAVDCTIENLDNLELALIPILHDLGKYHAVHVAGFQLDYLPVFMNAVLRVVRTGLRGYWTDDVSDAWQHLMAFIAEQIAVGVAEGRGKAEGLVVERGKVGCRSRGGSADAEEEGK